MEKDKRDLFMDEFIVWKWGRLVEKKYLGEKDHNIDVYYMHNTTCTHNATKCFWWWVILFASWEIVEDFEILINIF